MNLLRNKKGFAHLAVFLIVVAVLIGFVGYVSWGAYNARQARDAEQYASPAETYSDKATDLTWAVPSLPLNNVSWAKLDTEQGIHQFHLARTTCVITAQQPAGLIERDITSEVKVVEDGIDYLAEKVAKTTEAPAVLSENPLRFEHDWRSAKVGYLNFTTKEVLFKDVNIKAKVAAYQNSDFALVMMAVCKENDYNSNYEKMLEPFMLNFKVILSL